MCRWGQRRDCEEGEVTHIHIKSKERIEEEEEEEEKRGEMNLGVVVERCVV